MWTEFDCWRLVSSNHCALLTLTLRWFIWLLFLIQVTRKRKHKCSLPDSTITPPTLRAWNNAMWMSRACGGCSILVVKDRIPSTFYVTSLILEVLNEFWECVFNKHKILWWCTTKNLEDFSYDKKVLLLGVTRIQNHSNAYAAAFWQLRQ